MTISTRSFFSAALAAAAIALAATTASAQQTQKITATKAGDYGLTYSLPVTALDITIEAERVDLSPGEFFNYSRKYLGLDPIMAPSTDYSLKSVTINPRGEAPADNDARYVVKFKSGSAPFIILSPEGLPLSINAEGAYAPEPLPFPVPSAKQPEPSILSSPEARQAMTAEMLQAQSKAKKAELAAARIMEIRQNRSDIISGQADNMPADGKAMQLALDNLARQEAALTAMFTGTETRSTIVRTIPWIPDGNSDAPSISKTVTRLSPVDGIVAPDNLSGDPIVISVDILERGEYPVNDKGEALRFPKNGVAYNIPGRARVSASYQGKTLFCEEMEMAQLGIVFGLDPSAFSDKKAPAAVSFYPSTGAIKELSSATR
ncbi:MAG: DUF4831 family protein [Pseudoflavonifractor sp.]|nr:DUF4831 family protein [Alloprevotella sp.]MCM1116383.1 DUF4831 family protein [Pseudoflavonifractor sp.]